MTNSGESDKSDKAADQTQHDTGLLGLTLIARFHRIAVSAEELRHKFAPAVKNLGERAFFGDQEILLAGRSLGLKAGQRSLERLDCDNAILPALCEDSNGEYFILSHKIPSQSGAAAADAVASLENEAENERFLIHRLGNPPEIKKLSWKEIRRFWDGKAILLTPRRSPFFGQFREFNFRWFIPSVIKYRRVFFQVIMFSCLIQIFGLITPIFFQLVMDKVLVHKALTTLDVLAIGFLAASAFEVTLNAARNYLFSHTTTRVDVELGSRLFQHLAALPLDWFQARQAGQSVARVRELDTLRNFITSSALTLVIDLSFTVIYFFVMWKYSRTLTLTVLASIPLYVLLSVFITPILRHRLDRKFHYGAISQSFLVESITGIETIKSLALEPRTQRNWENKLAGYVSSSFRAQNFGQMAGQAASFIQKLTVLLIIWFGARQVMDGDLTVGQLVAFNMIAGRISGPILKLTQLWQDFQQAGISLRRLGDILNTPPEPGQDQGLSGPPDLRGAVKFDKVTFRYRPDAPAAVRDLSFEIKPGEIIGLAGPSGSGKSTVAKLIQRLYRAESGRILADGIDTAMVQPAWLRRQIGVVPRESVLFSGTVRENIALTNPAVPMEKVVMAAQMAGAHDFISELPEGYDTQVGERGCALSGGQRQRLAIARVLIGDPRILIFDEATSALDYESEKIIQASMGRICRNRTALIIAHRLSALRTAGRIMVLDRGCLVESGTPKELYEKKGFFYKMAQSQK